MSKRLDPNGLSGAFKKGPPMSLDFLIPQRNTPPPATEAEVQPNPATFLPYGFAVIRRDIWTPAAPPPQATTWREALTQRALQFVGRVLSCVI